MTTSIWDSLDTSNREPDLWAKAFEKKKSKYRYNSTALDFQKIANYFQKVALEYDFVVSDDEVKIIGKHIRNWLRSGIDYKVARNTVDMYWHHEIYKQATYTKDIWTHFLYYKPKLIRMAENDLAAEPYDDSANERKLEALLARYEATHDV